MTIRVLDLAIESDLVGRLSSFKDGRPLQWGDEGLAAEAIIRLRSVLNLELDKVHALQVRLSEVETELEEMHQDRERELAEWRESDES